MDIDHYQTARTYDVPVKEGCITVVKAYGVTLAEAEAHNTGALLESDGVVANDAKVTYTYKKKGLFSSKSTEFPTEPGTYIQTAQATGNYSCEKITRTIVIY